MNCGTTMGLAPHHIKSKGAGGSDEMDNLISLCMVCHNMAQEGWMAIGHRETRSGAKRKKYYILEGFPLKVHLHGLIKGG